MTDKMVTVQTSRRNTILTLGVLTFMNAFIILMGLDTGGKTPFVIQPWYLLVLDLGIMFGLMFLFVTGVWD